MPAPKPADAVGSFELPRDLALKLIAVAETLGDDPNDYLADLVAEHFDQLVGTVADAEVLSLYDEQAVQP